jgi:hypothetical protein
MRGKRVKEDRIIAILKEAEGGCGCVCVPSASPLMIRTSSFIASSDCPDPQTHEAVS